MPSLIAAARIAGARYLRTTAQAANRLLPGIGPSLAPPGTRRHSAYLKVVVRAVGAVPPTVTIGSGASRPDPASIRLRRPERPEVSVVVCVYGQLDHTARCLASISATTADLEVEVIVVDDASPDETGSYLAEVVDLTVITNEENLGFLQSCNRGIASSRGEVVVLLNNDTQGLGGWLHALLQSLRSDAGIGLVGARLVYPDGRLQEAGSIIWQDGSGWNYGRGDDPTSPPYCYRRDVDYCSAAAVALPRRVFDEIGGFDDRYSPAYYEDVDLAFTVREMGLRTVYEPASTVVHDEGTSHGTSVTSGGKVHQVKNQETFAERWRERLATQQRPGVGNVLLSRDRRRGPRILIIDHAVPTPDRDAGSLRMRGLLDLLLERDAAITFLPANLVPEPPYTAELQACGIEVLYNPFDVRKHLRDLGQHLDLVILSRPLPASGYLPIIRRVAPEATVFYDAVDLHFVRAARRAEIRGGVRSALLARQERRRELAVIRGTDGTIVVSPEEADELRAMVPDRPTVVIPTMHEIPPDRALSPAGRSILLFVGSFLHDPNIDAARYLVEEVLPAVRAQGVALDLVIAGASSDGRLDDLRRPGVVLAGWVPDLTSLYQSTRVFLAPIRYGAGVKGKVGEAMAHGLPVVTTPIGAEGFSIVNGTHALVRSSVDELAEAVAELCSDDSSWTAISRAGQQFVTDNFTLDSARPAVEALLATARPRR